jgi:hypothetical protein
MKGRVFVPFHTGAYPKYYGLVPTSTQQLLREAPVECSITVSSESVCQVARSWVDVGSFSHTFTGEVYDFYSVSPEYFGYSLVDIYRHI